MILSRSCCTASNFLNADLRCCLYLLIPAASSNIRFRSSAVSDRISSIIFSSITEYASEPIPVSTNKSWISFNLHGVRLIKYSDSPSRYTRRPISISLYSKGNFPRLLWTVKNASQTERGFRLSAPLKITSPIFPDRNTEYFCSPNTHRMASTILVFPQPLGPTITVTPSPNFSFSFLAKDLKP